MEKYSFVFCDLTPAAFSSINTISLGWLGYSDEKVARLAKERMSEGWTAFKMKVMFLCAFTAEVLEVL